MASNASKLLGTEKIGKLLIKQSLPASIGILVMSINMIVDTIFVGQLIGSLAIAAIAVALAITFFVSSLGMAIGVGGSSIVSRALGAGDLEKAKQTFGNQIVLTLICAVVFILIGILFRDPLLILFGAKGAILAPAIQYFDVLIIGVFFLTFCMTGNPVVRAEGKAKFAMTAMILPAIGNVIGDYLLICVFDFGIVGAAWATSIAYFICFAFIFWFFISKHSELKLSLRHFSLKKGIVKEIASLGMVTMARQSVVTILYGVLHNRLFVYGGETAVSAFGIIGRMLMFALFPVYGVTQGFLPIAGYNYGAKLFKRVRETINKAILSASVLGTFVFLIIFIFPDQIVSVFSKDEGLITETPDALRWVFAFTPLIAIQLIGTAYFQAIGKAIPALLLTLTKQGFFLIPLILILPEYFGLLGIWMSFPIADCLSTILTGIYLNREVKFTLKKEA
ncbi:MAG: MATE family efflux transporter [Flavobacteriaceae bacterium]|nr:MATE family efflux transporter [Flavobacteriaceae bacterium]